MKMFDKNYIDKELKRIDKNLNQRIDLYLIGGAAMSFTGLKDATKDIDVVVTGQEGFKALLDALKKSGYRDIIIKTRPYREMETKAVLENSEGFRWDIFVDRICRGLQLSEGMIRRSTEFLKLNKMLINLICPEDIFVFKSITSRERDREDMHNLFIHGLDFDIIKEEIIRQSGRSMDKAWIAFFFLGLEEFREKYGVLIPNYGEFYEVACEDALEGIILEIINEKGCGMEEIFEKINYPEELIDNQIEKMIRKRLIKRDSNNKLTKCL